MPRGGRRWGIWNGCRAAVTPSTTVPSHPTPQTRAGNCPGDNHRKKTDKPSGPWSVGTLCEFGPAADFTRLDSAWAEWPHQRGARLAAASSPAHQNRFQPRIRHGLVPSLDCLSHPMPWLAARQSPFAASDLKPPEIIGRGKASGRPTKYFASAARNTTCLITGEAGRGSKSRGEKQTGDFNRTE